MKRLIGVEIRRYATVAVDFNHEKDIPNIVKGLVQAEDESLDWNEPEIDYIETLSEEIEDENVSPIYDNAYEEMRDGQIA